MDVSLTSVVELVVVLVDDPVYAFGDELLWIYRCQREVGLGRAGCEAQLMKAEGCGGAVLVCG